MKHNTETIKKIMLYLFTIEAAILLSAGVYNLVKDNSIILPSLVILIAGCFISLLKTKITKLDAQKEPGAFKKRIVIWIIVFGFSMMLAALRKRILEKYFIGQQITVLVIWFLTGVVIGNIIVLIIQQRKVKQMASRLIGSSEETR